MRPRRAPPRARRPLCKQGFPPHEPRLDINLFAELVRSLTLGAAKALLGRDDIRPQLEVVFLLMVGEEELPVFFAKKSFLPRVGHRIVNVKRSIPLCIKQMLVEESESCDRS